jgi:hypothetical protein
MINIIYNDDLQKYKNAGVAKRETLFLISWVCGLVDRMKVGRKIHWFLVDS